MSFELASSAATYSSSQMGVSSRANLMNKILSFLLKHLPDPGHMHGSDDPVSRLFSVFAEKNREEITRAFIGLSIIICLMLGMTSLIGCSYKLVCAMTMKVYSWIFGDFPWATRLVLLKQREKAVSGKEAMIVQQTQSLQLDVEIALYKRLVGVLERSAATSRDKASDLEMEKELFVDELIRGVCDISGQCSAMRRTTTADGE
ncbi:hypothetical protein C8R41DRAFT_919923 [Lentinula lateritia]|uniref:Uncharacterized protein n=1 Tax=Lentinula lateritia TaxID=40482 RepID=A0ABQ8VFI2_9AGAR|nr:hypothetical protein C8R41DRAFT_919923 [Lentinula lateritia]